MCRGLILNALSWLPVSALGEHLRAERHMGEGGGSLLSVCGGCFLLSNGGITHQELAYCMFCRCAVIPAAPGRLTPGLKVVLISKLQRTPGDNILQMPFASFSRLVFE